MPHLIGAVVECANSVLQTRTRWNELQIVTPELQNIVDGGWLQLRFQVFREWGRLQLRFQVFRE